MKAKIYFVVTLYLITIVTFTGCNSQKQLDENAELFDQTIEDLQNNFLYEGFEEIMHDESYLLGLPMEQPKIDKADNFLFLQKLFVYKSKKQGVVIMLQVTYNQHSKNQWISSIDYHPEVFNWPSSKFGKNTYIEDVPEVEIACNSFSFKNCNYSITCFSGVSDSALAATTLTDFSNQLIKYITSK